MPPAGSPSYIGAILDVVGEGVIAIDTQQTIRLVNDEAERVFGYARSKLVGKTVDVLIPDAYKSRHAAAFERRLSDPSPMAVRYVEVEGRRKDGSLFPLEIRFTRSTLGAEQVFVAAVRDISERVADRKRIADLHARVRDERDELLEEVVGLRREIGALDEMGAFTLEARVGHGGMGEVWRANHRLLARPAAVKLIRPEVLAGGDRSKIMLRFEREAQVTASLMSPHSVSLYDFGATDDGVLYYVMELLDGIDLESLVAQHGPLPAARVIHFLLQVCHSLEEAHCAGLVHRDIKPANIYTCRYGLDLDFIKVLDFGLVALRSTCSSEDKRLTARGNAPGTPEYMAPEMHAAPGTIDGRADIYSLGCVAYFLLTNEVVFDGPTSQAIAIAHTITKPTPPSQRTDEPIPAELEAIVLACLAKDPSARPRDAGALRSALESVTTDGSWTPGQTERWWATHLPKAENLRRPPSFAVDPLGETEEG